MSARSLPIFLNAIGLGWTAPDGTQVLTDLSVSFGRERVGIVGRNGVGKSTLLKCLGGELPPTTGRIACAGTIATMSQLVQVDTDARIADLMGAGDALRLLRKAESGDASVEVFADIDWTLESRIAEALDKVGLIATSETRLVDLSGGQRTRAALAGAIMSAPDFLLLDEPTNDLDAEGRRAVRDLLEGWKAGAIVVSHDRELLQIMDAIVEVTPLGAKRYGGNWDDYRARKDIEIAAVESEVAFAERVAKQVERKTQQAQERKQRRDASGQRKAMRGDMPRILAGARRYRAERSGGDGANLAQRLKDDAKRELDTAVAKVDRHDDVRVLLASCGLSDGQRVLDARNITFAYAGSAAILSEFSLSIIGPERVAISGANGTGKTTLLEILSGSCIPQAGTVSVGVRFAYFDQRVSLLEPDASIVDNFKRINPGVEVQSCHGALARFGFKAEMGERLVSTLSGGQLLRAALACVLGSPSPPRLLLLDEPTNHLDIDTIAAVEAGLLAFDGALLVVSHDAAFLEAIGIERFVAME